MNSISRLNRMMEALRQQMAESAKRLDAPTHGSPAEKTRAHTRAARPAVQELRLHIRERIRALAPSGAEGRRKARRIFLESVIAWEFGEPMLLDRQLERIIDSIEDTFDDDPELDRQFEHVLSQLVQR